MSILVVSVLAAFSTTLLGPPAATAGEADDLSLVVQQDARVSEMVRASRSLTQPARMQSSAGEWTLILPRGLDTYALPALAAAFPDSIADHGGGAFLVKEHVLVAPGAALAVEAPAVVALRLHSSSDRFVTITAYKATLDFIGKSTSQIDVVSVDGSTGDPDTSLADGRAYVATRGGSMDIAHSAFSHLGFGIGQSSGVAWKGWADEKSRGSVTDSVFQQNYFGAYTFEAEEMVWERNVFADNDVYGFDPHDASNYFRVEHNRAYGNGRHGIIFSAACIGNVIRHNQSFDNGWHGIVLDDGKVADDGVARHARPRPSNDNIVEHNEVWGNEVGIALEGGYRNRIAHNVVRDNRFGIRLKDDASGNVVVDNTVVGSEVFGIYAYASSNQNLIVGNEISGGKAGFVVRDAQANIVRSNNMAGVQGHAVAGIGDVSGSYVGNNKLSGRGSSAIDLLRAMGPVVAENNDAAGWYVTPGFRPLKLIADTLRHHPPLLIWLVVLVIPVLLRVGAPGGPGRNRQPVIASAQLRSGRQR